MRRGIVLQFVVLMGLMTACGSDGGGETTVPAGGAGDTTTTSMAATTTTTAADTTTTAAETTTTVGEETMDGVHAVESELGTILVDGDGFTLYAFTVDGEEESACYEGCAELWPPVPADTEIASDLDASLFGSIARTDGIEQLTVDGRPLYRYTPDTSPGDVTGQGFNDVWFVVDPSGGLVGAPEAADSGDVIIDYGY